MARANINQSDDDFDDFDGDFPELDELFGDDQEVDRHRNLKLTRRLSARRRLEDLRYERELRQALSDWDDYRETA